MKNEILVKLEFFVILFILNPVNSIWAQNSKNLKTSLVFEVPLVGREYISPAKGDGSPFLYDSWKSGYIILESGDTITGKPLNFDCLNNKLLCLSNNIEIIELDRNFIKGFGIYSNDPITVRKFETRSIKLPFISDSAKQFVEILVKGKFNLYAYTKVKIYNEKPAGNESSSYMVNSYIKKVLFYVQMDNFPLQLINPSRKSLLNSFPEYKAKIKRILKDNHSSRMHNLRQIINSITIINHNWS